MLTIVARRTAAVACAGALLGALPVFTPPAAAEVIYLKNGTQVKGKITKQDEETFDVLTQQGPMKIAKHRVALEDMPIPVVAAGLGIGFPGAGQAYVGRWDKAAFYIFITSITFGTALVVGMYSFNGGITVSDASKMTFPVVTAVTTAAIPLALGSYDAFLEATRQNAEPKFKIQYNEGL